MDIEKELERLFSEYWDVDEDLVRIRDRFNALPDGSKDEFARLYAEYRDLTRTCKQDFMEAYLRYAGWGTPEEYRRIIFEHHLKQSKLLCEHDPAARYRPNTGQVTDSGQWFEGLKLSYARFRRSLKQEHVFYDTNVRREHTSCQADWQHDEKRGVPEGLRKTGEEYIQFEDDTFGLTVSFNNDHEMHSPALKVHIPKRETPTSRFMERELARLGYSSAASDDDYFSFFTKAKFSKRIHSQEELDAEFKKIMDVMYASLRRSDSLEEFLVSVFGENTDIDALKRDLQDRGDIRSLRKLHGGFSAQAVVSLEDRVVKLDGNLDAARLQAEFFSRDYGKLNAYIPKTIPGSFRTVGDVAVWEMTDVSKKNKNGNLFSKSRASRAKPDGQSSLVSRHLEMNPYYANHRLSAKKEGAQNLYDHIDHYMYILGLFHSAASKDPVSGLSSGPADHSQRLLSFNPYSNRVYSELKRLVTPQKLAELASPLEETYGVLKEGAGSVIHGDFWINNTLGGTLIDPNLRVGNETEDITRFLKCFELAPEHEDHFFNRYVLHRSKHDAEFRDSYQKQFDMRQLRRFAKYANYARSAGALLVQDLSLPENMHELGSCVEFMGQSGLV